MFGRRKNKGTTEHTYVEERLSAYLDGELTSREQTTVERHLAECQACRWNLETLQQTVLWARELPAVQVPRVFTIPVPAEPVRAPRPRWTAPLLQGATVLAALLLFFVAAGDLMLTQTGQDASFQSEPAMDVMPTEVAMEMERVEAPQAAEAEPEAATILDTVVVEKEVEAIGEVVEEAAAAEAPAESKAMASPPPEGGGAAPEPTETMSGLSGPSLAPPTDAAGGEAPVGDAAAGDVAAEGEAEAPLAPPPEPAFTATPAGTATPTEQPMMMLATSAPLATTLPEREAPVEESAPSREGTASENAAMAPTSVAAAREVAAPDQEPGTWAGGGSLLDPMTLGLRMAEIALLVIFVVLLVTTVVVMVRNRRVP